MKKTCALVLLCVMLMAVCLPASASEEKPFEGVTLTYWVRLHNNVAAVANSLNETEWYRAIHEATGITIDFIHPTVGSEKEEFSLLCASGEYPDIIEHTWTDYNGGAAAAIEDGVIIDLNDVMANNAPNLRALLDANPDVDKAVKTQEGDYYVFPFLRGTSMTNNKTLFSNGFVVRNDWLQELGLGELPSTIDEWYEVFTAMKGNGVEVPLTIRPDWLSDAFSAGFDNWKEFYVEDGVVKNGLVEDSRFDYLQTLAKWYAEGLLDPDYLTATASSCQTYFVSGKSGVTYAPGGSGLGTYTTTMMEVDSEITVDDIVSTVPVTSVKGQNAKFSKMSAVYDGTGNSAAISTQCTNLEAAAWLLDFMYSEEGLMINNFGIEGESYEMIDGYPTYTEVITNNPDGLSMTGAMSLYIRGHIFGPLVQDERELEQYYALPNQQDALNKWVQTDYGLYIYPPATISSEYASDFATIWSNITTYRDEMEAKFISGQVELTKESFDEYVAQIYAYGMEDALMMKQQAYDAYMAM